jgi:hypothetical protein
MIYYKVAFETTKIVYAHPLCTEFCYDMTDNLQRLRL